MLGKNQGQQTSACPPLSDFVIKFYWNTATLFICILSMGAPRCSGRPEQLKQTLTGTKAEYIYYMAFDGTSLLTPGIDTEMSVESGRSVRT